MRSLVVSKFETGVFLMGLAAGMGRAGVNDGGGGINTVGDMEFRKGIYV